MLQVASLSSANREGEAAAEQLSTELANARHSLEQCQGALRDGQLHQTQMVSEYVSECVLCREMLCLAFYRTCCVRDGQLH